MFGTKEKIIHYILDLFKFPIYGAFWIFFLRNGVSQPLHRLMHASFYSFIKNSEYIWSILDETKHGMAIARFNCRSGRQEIKTYR